MTRENGKYGGPAYIGGIRAWSQAVSEPTSPPGGDSAGEHPAVRRGGLISGPGADSERSRPGRLGGRGAAGRRGTWPEAIYLGGVRSTRFWDDGGLCTAVVSGHHVCPADTWDGSC